MWLQLAILWHSHLKCSRDSCPMKADGVTEDGGEEIYGIHSVVLPEYAENCMCLLTL